MTEIFVQLTIRYLGICVCWGFHFSFFAGGFLSRVPEWFLVSLAPTTSELEYRKLTFQLQYKWTFLALISLWEQLTEYTTEKYSSTPKISWNCQRFEPRSHFKSRLNLIVRVNVVLNRTVVVDSDRRFNNLCDSHLQSESELYHVSWWYYTPVIDLIGQLRNLEVTQSFRTPSGFLHQWRLLLLLLLTRPQNVLVIPPLPLIKVAETGLFDVILAKLYVWKCWIARRIMQAQEKSDRICSSCRRKSEPLISSIRLCQAPCLVLQTRRVKVKRDSSARFKRCLPTSVSLPDWIPLARKIQKHVHCTWSIAKEELAIDRQEGQWKEWSTKCRKTLFSTFQM